MAADPEQFARIAGRVRLDALADRFVVVVGVGSVGSLIALHLASGCGVGHVGLVDGELLERHNLPRHVLPAAYLGANKAEGMAAFLRASVPGLDVGAIPRHIDAGLSLATLDRLLAPADLIVIATDDRAAQRLVAERALALDIPAVVPALYADRGGEVFVQLGPAHPCLLCWDAFRPADARTRAVSALHADALAIVQLTVLLCIALLDDQSPEMRELAPPADDPRPRQLFVQQPGAALRRVPMRRREDCPACAVGPSPTQPNPGSWRGRILARGLPRFFSGLASVSATDWSYAHTHAADPPSIDFVNVSEVVLVEGDSVRLSWSATNAVRVEIDGLGSFDPAGFIDVTLRETRFFAVTAINPFGRRRATTAPVRVLPLPRLGDPAVPSFVTDPPPSLTPPLGDGFEWPALDLPGAIGRPFPRPRGGRHEGVSPMDGWRFRRASR